ncbi:AraC family transcriptional regulator [Marinobacter psychrophilus]|jgi:AraC-like DNA-binding protein|uniref:AraC family transcriptional regulator n=1 Tax=Marinobacter psychrophilus TaxID=330734 RepID=UPI001B61646B|nr:AraC family transcriptional regulator [Marinobacter psychrophilus]MBQ0763994.1 AraC family transcriptional regulator [Marinobacter psychrophilus]MBQ0843884.1 AraC family transcriptional regulator [Marinobacter psychrophilus]
MALLATERLRPAIHPTYARLVCAHLRQEGFDNETILQGTRLQWEQLLSGNRYLSLEQLARLLRRATALTRTPWLGLDIGGITSVSAHGALGYAIVSAPNLRVVLHTLARFTRLRFQLVNVVISETDEHFTVSMEELSELGDVREFIYSALLVTYLQLVDTVTSQRLRNIQIELPISRPQWADVYQQRCGCPVMFDAPAFRLQMPVSVLDTPCLTADAGTFRTALRDCENQLRQLDNGGALSQQVSNCLLNSSDGYPGLDEVASRLAMSRRTLIRRLKIEGTSYQELLDGVRQELAAWYLLETTVAVEQIAERLGYQDTSNFSRTFRRWFGMTPHAMRNGDI